jgi:microcystin-dependent protein
MKRIPRTGVLPTLALALVLTVVLAAVRAPAQDAVPGSINYQGRLLDASGTNVVNGNYEIAFRIWAAGNPTTPIWGRTLPVNIHDGVFNVVLGDGGNPIDGAQVTDIRQAFGDRQRYLGITVTRDATGTAVSDTREIAPRQQFLSSPFALMANDSASLGGVAAEDYARRGANDSLAARQVTVTNLTVTGQLQAATTVGGGWVPVGGIIMWSGAPDQIPAGWALCDGRNGTPNLQDRFVLGWGKRPPGEHLGAESVTLTTAQLPAHSHTLSSGTVGYHASYNSSAEALRSPTASENHGNFDLATSSTGTGAAVPILPPYWVLAFIQRTQ